MKEEAESIYCKDIDWEQRRYEISKEILPYTYVSDSSVVGYNGESINSPKNRARYAVQMADALIEVLKEDDR